MKSTIVGVGIVWTFVVTAVYRTDSDAYRMKSCNTLFLLYLDLEEPSEKKKERKTHKAREMTEGTALRLSVCFNPRTYTQSHTPTVVLEA